MVVREIETFRANVVVKNILWDCFVVSQEGVTALVEMNSELNTKSMPFNYSHVTHDYEVPTVSEDYKHGTVLASKCDIGDKMYQLNIGTCSEPEFNVTDGPKKRKSERSLRLFVNGYLLSLFVKTLQISLHYRKSVISHFSRCFWKMKQYLHSQHVQVVIKLTHPRRDIIDFVWNERIEQLVVERRELDNAMSWLSTLGGAFSALGEQFEHCAEMAGRISVHQLKIALRLGDPYTVARCKLYLALSLLQRGHLKRARRIIREQYKFATAPPILDYRLIRMCLGIWAKLKFEHAIKRNEQQKHQEQH